MGISNNLCNGCYNSGNCRAEGGNLSDPAVQAICVGGLVGVFSESRAALDGQPDFEAEMPQLPLTEKELTDLRNRTGAAALQAAGV